MQRVPLVKLGNTGPEVSRLGFGEVDFGDKDPYHLGPKEGWRILTEGFKLGVRFWDVCDAYSTHPHGARAIRLLPRKKLAISYKTGAKSPEKALKSLHSLLDEFGTDYVDILMLHCVQSNWKGWPKMVKELSRIKATGLARAVGLSTHSVTVVKQASEIEEVDVILTICCKANAAVVEKYIPIEDGTLKEMHDSIKLAHEKGKGTVAMKILGGRVVGPAPALTKNYRSSISSIAGLDFVDAIFIGMSNLEEVRKNIEAVASAEGP